MKNVSAEREAIKKAIANIVLVPIVVVVGIVAMNEVLYEHYMRKGQSFRAFIIRPFHFIRKAVFS